MNNYGFCVTTFNPFNSTRYTAVRVPESPRWRILDIRGEQLSTIVVPEGTTEAELPAFIQSATRQVLSL
jgi:hypothetical protein